MQPCFRSQGTRLFKSLALIVKQAVAFLAFVSAAGFLFTDRHAADGTAMRTAAIDPFVRSIRRHIDIQDKNGSDKDEDHSAFKSEGHCVRHEAADRGQDAADNKIGDHPKEPVAGGTS